MPWHHDSIQKLKVNENMNIWFIQVKHKTLIRLQSAQEDVLANEELSDCIINASGNKAPWDTNVFLRQSSLAMFANAQAHCSLTDTELFSNNKKNETQISHESYNNKLMRFIKKLCIQASQCCIVWIF